MILDIHTHHPVPQPEGVVALRFSPDMEKTFRLQPYSLGVHPWDTVIDHDDIDWNKFERMARATEIMAIGEAGIDLGGKGGALFRQMNIFKRQIEISEILRKPLIIHDVKAHDIIIGLRRDLKPAQKWVIHGFRGKPELAMSLIKSGCYISFGEKFNPNALVAIPEDRILAETDESPLSIEEIIELISVAKDKDMKEVISANTKDFLNIRNF